MTTLNLLMPWRWKRRVGAALGAKLQATSDTLAARLNDVRNQLAREIAQQLADNPDLATAQLNESGSSLLATLNAVRDQLAREIAQQCSAWLTESSASVLAALSEVRDQLQNRISEQFDEICELREETTLCVRPYSAATINLPPTGRDRRRVMSGEG